MQKGWGFGWLSAAAGLILLTSIPVRADPVGSDPRMPLVHSKKLTSFEDSIVWSPAVRRILGLLERFDKAAKEDLAAFRAKYGDSALALAEFARGVSERFSTDRYQSLVVETMAEAQLWDAPITWDLAAGKVVSWTDLLKAPNGDAARMIAGYLKKTALPAAIAQADKDKRRQLRADAEAMLAGSWSSWPRFTFVPSKDAGHVAGLYLFFGKPQAFGVNESATVTAFLPSNILIPYLADAYAASFGGEPIPFRSANRGNEEFKVGLPLVLLGGQVPPTKTLSLRMEAPAIYFAPNGSIDARLVYEGSRPVPGIARLDPSAAPSGAVWATRVFTATFVSKDKPFDGTCRGDYVGVRPAKGSEGERLGAPELQLLVPIKINCGDYDG